MIHLNPPGSHTPPTTTAGGPNESIRDSPFRGAVDVDVIRCRVPRRMYYTTGTTSSQGLSLAAVAAERPMSLSTSVSSLQISSTFVRDRRPGLVTAGSRILGSCG